ncbi:MAG: hypothetical protein ACLQT6_07005 [Desulfomonilaceae bacterium]
MAIFFKNEQHILIQLESDVDWHGFCDCCEGYITQRDFEQIRNYLKQSAKTVVIEKGYVDADYRDTYFNFFSRKFAQYPSKTIRANFFTEKISPKMLFKLDRYQDQYIGFVVLRPNRVRSVGRTILNPEKLSFVTGHVCLAEYPVHILGAELTARGFPYMSQDSDVTVCAHAACWMIFRYFSQRYNRYAEKWPYEVSQLTRDVSMGRLVPSKGLTAFQVTEMFANFGFAPEIYIRENHPDLFYTLLYMYVESGLPVVAGLTKRRHAITVIGHVSDYHIFHPETLKSSDTYLHGLIVNDDNFMPYQVVRKNDMAVSGYHQSQFKMDDIDAFIVPLYEKIHLSAEYVVKLADATLTHEKFGLNAMSNPLKYEEIVTRTFLTSSKSFKGTRRLDSLPFGITDIYCEMAMPKFIWVCELSTPDLFKNGDIVGEIIFDATANPYDTRAFLSIHYPDALLLNNRDFLTDDTKGIKSFRANSDRIIPYSCYVNNLCEV